MRIFLFMFVTWDEEYYHERDAEAEEDQPEQLLQGGAALLAHVLQPVQTRALEIRLEVAGGHTALHCNQPVTTWAHGTLELGPCAFVIIMGNFVNSTYKRLSTITLFKTSLSNPW